MAVIDWIIPDGEQADFFLQSLAPREVLLVVLSPTIEVCQERNAARDPDESFVFDGYEGLIAAMRSGFGAYGWWLDTSHMSAEETASQILGRISIEMPARAGDRQQSN